MVLSVSAKENPLGLHSTYNDLISKQKIELNVEKDYGMKSDATNDQSAKLQKAIDEVSAKGGGRLIIPKGTYCIAGVNMKSNVHLLVDSGVTFKPYIADTKKGCVLFLFSSSDDKKESYVENCSIRCLQEGKSYTVDYSYLKPIDRCRFIICCLVKNFYIADAKIMDNYTTHCGIIFVPTRTEGADKWKLSRPTDGEIRNCSIYHSKTGYGLCQMHGAQTIYYENLYSKGGVTLRLESGAGGPYAGVFDINARNIRSEQGRCAVMMNPHATHNGRVLVDGASSIGSGVTVMVHGGFIDRKHQDNPNATKGTYSSDSKIINIHAVYGENAQIDEKQVYALDPIDSEYAKFRNNSIKDGKSFRGPSMLPVLDCTLGNYKVSYENISSEGFANNKDYVVYEQDIEDRKKANSAIIAKLPIQLPAKEAKEYKKR